VATRPSDTHPPDESERATTRPHFALVCLESCRASSLLFPGRSAIVSFRVPEAGARPAQSGRVGRRAENRSGVDGVDMSSPDPTTSAWCASARGGTRPGRRGNRCGVGRD
jgi:hypothetical protein